MDLPVQSGQSLGSSDYIVNIGLGTPKRTLSLIFDTGSDLTWTQCKPCIRSCYRQQDPIFDPTTSTTYSNVSCSPNECYELSSATGKSPGCASETCIYRMQYGDDSFSVGFFSKERLTVTNDVFQDFFFGCGQNNQGLFGNTAGIIGLGRHPLSIISQTAPKYGKYFSYCLPSTSSQTGYLTLGKIGLPNNVKFTPFATYNSQGKSSISFYFIEIVSIIIGGRQLPVFTQSTFKTIIDSTTVITRLPPKAYSILRDEFRKMMSKYPTAPGYSILDTCYDLSGYRYVTLPVITIVFGGNVRVDLAPSGIVIVISRTRVCLAFAANDYESDVGIFGSTQQKTLEVVYDVGGGYLGFGPFGCK
ncbi:Aspartyl protease [Handroanthus impetiginosus]|uniref:Aspartyl protease n=1 Tax=Handroanthus impetiginosus TaxID=429701 RepID=A0A2G9H8R9_9LAMI|nr:Aspartyl protease [Handroanthus impetiginosus]